MIPGSLARRYARALIGLAQSPIQRDKLATDLEAFADVAGNKDEVGRPVLATLATERFAMADRSKLLDVLLRRVGADPLTGKFLRLVLQRGRIEGAPDIARAYRRMADEAAGRINAQITSAAPLSPDSLAKIKAALEKATGRQVVATTAVDPALLGGVALQVGSYLIDGSVRTALAQMRQALRA